MRRLVRSKEIALKKRNAALLEALEPRQLLHGVSAITPYNGQQNVAVNSNVADFSSGVVDLYVLDSDPQDGVYATAAITDRPPSVGVAGSAGFVNGNYVVSASGTDIGGTSDSFRYVYQQITGNVQLTARVTSLGSTNLGAKAGVLLRTSLAANSISAGMFVTAGSGYAATRRTTAGGATTSTTGGTSALPYWVRIVCSGTTATTYRSVDGVSWTQVSTATVNLGTTIYVGLAVTSKSNSALTTAVFDNVSITALP